MGNGDFGLKDSNNSSYIQGQTGENSASPGSPITKLAESSNIDKLPNINTKEFKEENGDGRPEPDTKDESLVSMRDNQESVSLAGSKQEVVVPKEKKKLKPTSSCYYYQQNNLGSSLLLQGQGDDAVFDKKSLNLENGSRLPLPHDESTKSVKNLVISSSKRKNTEAMLSPQAECLSGGTSEISNLNFPKLDNITGIESPISSRSTELVKTKSNRDKNEKPYWRNNESEKMYQKMGEDKSKGEYYKAEHPKKYLNSPKQHYTKKRTHNNPDKAGTGHSGGSHKQSNGVNGMNNQGSYLTDKHFPSLEEANEPKQGMLKPDHHEKQEKLPLGLVNSSEGKKKKKTDRKTKK